MLGVFAFTLFSSASLLFLIEPMVGKMMLPLLGGTPAVWNTCMVFFQAVLLAGYLYAHATTSWFGPRKQAVFHLAVLGLPLLFFLINGPLIVNENLIAGREGNPIPALLLVLTLSVGMPMFVVCTSAPLLQKWFADTDHPAARDPYFLYGASNMGSMLALLGYPLLVEPVFGLPNQRVYWAIGYALLALLTAACAYLMWKSRPALAFAGAEQAALAGEMGEGDSLEHARANTAVAVASSSIKSTKRQKRKIKKTNKSLLEPAPVDSSEREQPVTLVRRLRWVLLSLVPSSLMLGATTYITTDIAAIPLLWVLPLALYLLTFIIVFSHISARTQMIMVWAVIAGAAIAVGLWGPYLFEGRQTAGLLVWMFRVGAAAVLLFSWKLWKIRDPNLLHKAMVMVMPLLVLLLLFMMLSEIRPSEVANIAMHVVNLFVIAMVCHGELARDRPASRHLTEYFLLMSVGGVVGGLFNALIAPLIFNDVVEYSLVMMLACLLVPPLGAARESRVSRWADVGLAVLFVLTGGVLLFMYWRSLSGPWEIHLPARIWFWTAGALVSGLVLGLVAAWFGWGAPPAEPGQPRADRPIDRVLDVVLPFSLGILVIGLYWGLWADGIRPRVANFAEVLNIQTHQFVTILTYGVPAVLCYTFVERSIRFGLGVGAILLATQLCQAVEYPPLFQARSFFGVIRVSEELRGAFPYRKLMHGTTLHGMQFIDEELRTTPLTYYHRTGPIGLVFETYNKDASRPVGLIGLGTGTMACYGLPNQKMTFYDIDPIVKQISFDTDKYFSFVADARARGVDLDLILGDARLTLARNDLSDEKDRYGILVVDAFSSDAIPIHLITKEALAMYLTKVREDGLICFHISNRYLTLKPVLANLAKDAGLSLLHMSDTADNAAGKSASQWVVFARKPQYLKALREAGVKHKADFDSWSKAQMELLPIVAFPDNGSGVSATALLMQRVLGIAKRNAPYQWNEPKPDQDVGVWSDDYSNIISVFEPYRKWKGKVEED
jgi:hypothetical protein